MPGLRLRTVADAPSLRDWKHVHNEIIRAGQLSDEQVRDRAHRHHLEVVYPEGLAADGGCQTSITTAMGTPPNLATMGTVPRSSSPSFSRSDGVTSMTRYALTALRLLLP